MYIDSANVKSGKKIYRRHLLRASYRENGKVKHKTIINLSGFSEAEIAALKLALKHKDHLSDLISLDDLDSRSGKRIGAVWILKMIAERLGLTTSLGNRRDGKLALLQVMARIIDQGSRLSAVRSAQSHALCELIGIDELDEDDLYDNLTWIANNQEQIEKKLFSKKYSAVPPSLFLYDVTSSYLEGICNELGQYGHNRDKKNGKLQIVVGLLTGPDGSPVAVRVFDGNTPDTKTVSEQIRIVAESFGIKEVTLVGDRGMIKGPQIEELPEDFRYITAITKPQILRMLNEGKFQLELFSDKVCEIEDAGVRYVLRRNPLRALQLSESRESKLAAIVTFAQDLTKRLAEHPKAHVDKALNQVNNKIKQLKVEKWVSATAEGREIIVDKDPIALANESLLDGCYVIKSDVPKTSADAQTLHDRYCDLENVERAFRTMKTVHLDLRPIFVHTAEHTKGHVFVVMLALLLQRELERCWTELDLTVEEGIDELGAIQALQITLGPVAINTVPQPNQRAALLLEKASVVLPRALPKFVAHVHTKKKLVSERLAH